MQFTPFVDLLTEMAQLSQRVLINIIYYTQYILLPSPALLYTRMSQASNFAARITLKPKLNV